MSRTNEIEEMKNQIAVLSKSIAKLSNHFLSTGPDPPEDPPPPEIMN